MDQQEELKGADSMGKDKDLSSDVPTAHPSLPVASGFCQVLLATGDNEATPVLIPTEALNMVLQAVTPQGDSVAEAEPSQLLLQAKTNLQTGTEETIRVTSLEGEPKGSTLSETLQTEKLEEEVATTYIEIQQISEDHGRSEGGPSSDHSPKEKSGKKGCATIRPPAKKKVTKSPKTPKKKPEAKKSESKKSQPSPPSSSASSKSLAPGTVIPASSLLTGLLHRPGDKPNTTSKVTLNKKSVLSFGPKSSQVPKITTNFTNTLQAARQLEHSGRPISILDENIVRQAQEQMFVTEKLSDVQTSMPQSQAFQNLLITNTGNVRTPNVEPQPKAVSADTGSSKPTASGTIPQIMLLAEGGIANLAALQAGIIPLPLSLLQQAAANQGVSLTAGVPSQPVHVTLDPPQESSSSSLTPEEGENMVSSEIGLLRQATISGDLGTIEGTVPITDVEGKDQQTSPILQTIPEVLPTTQDTPAIHLFGGTISQAEVTRAQKQPAVFNQSPLLTSTTALSHTPLSSSKSLNKPKKSVTSSLRGMPVKKPSVMRPILPKGGLPTPSKPPAENSTTPDMVLNNNTVEELIGAVGKTPETNIGDTLDSMSQMSQSTDVSTPLITSGSGVRTPEDTRLPCIGLSSLETTPNATVSSSFGSADQVVSTANSETDTISEHLAQPLELYDSCSAHSKLAAAAGNAKPAGVTDSLDDENEMFTEKTIPEITNEDHMQQESQDDSFMLPQIDDSDPTTHHMPKDRVFSRMSVTLSKEILDVIPKSKGAFLSNLVAEYSSQLVAFPSSDMYTIQSYSFKDLIGIHQALNKLLEPESKADSEPNAVPEKEGGSEGENMDVDKVSPVKVIKVIKPRPRGRPRKIHKDTEDISSKAQPPVPEDDPVEYKNTRDQDTAVAEGSELKLSRPQFSRSGRPLKWRKMEAVDLEEDTKGQIPNKLQSGQKRRKVGRPRKYLQEDEILKEMQKLGKDATSNNPKHDLANTSDQTTSEQDLEDPKVKEESKTVQDDNKFDSTPEPAEHLSDQDRHSEKENIETSRSEEARRDKEGDITTPTVKAPSMVSSIPSGTSVGRMGHRYIKKKDYESAAPYKFFCSKCSFKTKRQSHYNRHMSLHKTSTALWHCDKCPFTALRLNHLRRHEQIHTGKILKCVKCSYECATPALMAKHYRKKHQMSDVGTLSCVKCDYKSETPELLVKHYRIKHQMSESYIPCSQAYQCKNCDYKTVRKHLFIRHMNVHTIKDKETLIRSSLPQEYLNKVVKNYTCGKCSYTTTHKEHYVRHMANVHEERRPYLCDTCGKSFKRQDSLRSHTIVHLDKTKRKFPKRCPVCQKGLRSNAHLKEHLTTHSTNRAYLCEICGASFKTRSVQRKHVQSIHKNPHSHACPKCPKMFNTKYSLLRHEKTHDTPGMRQVQEQVMAQVMEAQQQQQQQHEQLGAEENTKTQAQQLLMPENQSGEIILPQLSTDEMHSIQIELPNGEIITQSIQMPQQIIQVADGNITIAGDPQTEPLEIAPIEITPGEAYDQTAGEIVQQISAQPSLLQSEATTALLYLNTANL